MDALALALTAMLANTPEKFRPEVGTPRYVTYTEIANDIVSAVASPFDGLPFEGTAAESATVLALAAIAATESQYSADVRSCQRKGDGGASISVFQLLYGPTRWTFSEKEICSTPVLAAKLAIRTLNWYRGQAWAPIHLFQGYATGRADRVYYPSTKQHYYFAVQAKASKIKVTRHDGRLYAEFESSPVVVSKND